MASFRDRGIDFYEYLAQGKWRNHQELQTRLASLNAQQQEIVRQCVVLALDNGLHDFLFQLGVVLDESQDDPDVNRIQILVNGVDIAQISDGLQGESYGEEGWIKKYSRYK